MTFRNATITDLVILTQLESDSFQPNEAASVQSFSNRLKIFPHHFWLLENEGQVVGYVNGMVTNNQTITDQMFTNAALHDDNGAWQSIFGIAVAPAFRNKGYAGKLMSHLIEQSRQDNRAGITLTCKQHLIAYYKRFGFLDLGVSLSVHGGEVWYDMILKL